jgi:beta-N-acetylhexosaminidase
MLSGSSRGRARRARGVGTVALVVGLAAGLTGACTDDPTPDAGPPDAAPTSEPATPEPPTAAERLGLAPGWGPEQADLERAARLVRRLSVPELAGQVIVADWSGTDAPVGLVRSLHLGGVIAFADNITGTAQITRVNRRLQRAVPRPWPLLVGVDQEGGIVERVQADATRFPTFMSAGAADDPALTRAAYTASARELRGLGFDVDFAPVADVTIGPADPAIGSRSASSDPRLVADQVVAAAEGYLAGGVVPVLKHFPGHGSVTSDSHQTLPVQRRSVRRLRRTDLVPFRAAVDAGLPAVMVGHLDVRALDPGMSSSLSRRVVAGLLRRDLGFDGVVMTDSLEMAAVTRRFDSATSAVRALRAGVDVVLMPPDPRAARAGIVRAVRRGALSRGRLRLAAARMVALLLSTGDGGPGRRPGSAAAASRRLSAAALTVTRGPCRGRLVGDAIAPSGDPTAATRFAAVARRAGLDVLVPRTPSADLTTAEPRPDRRKGERRKGFERRVQGWERREQRRADALAVWRAEEAARLAAGTSVAFTGYGDGPVDGEVVVATDRPGVLGPSGGRVEIATYGDTPGAMSALVDVLLGRERAPGRLPVPVAGVQRQGC